MSFFFSALCFMLSSPATGFGQTTQPSQSTETFGAWTVRCQMPEGDEAKRTCEIVQVVRDKSGNALLQTAIGLGTERDTLIVVFQTPQGALLSVPVKLMVEDADSSVEASYFTCMNNVCLARADIRSGDLSPFGDRAAGFVEVTDRSGRKLRFAVSFEGLKASLERLRVLQQG